MGDIDLPSYGKSSTSIIPIAMHYAALSSQRNSASGSLPIGGGGSTDRLNLNERLLLRKRGAR